MRQSPIKPQTSAIWSLSMPPLLSCRRSSQISTRICTKMTRKKLQPSWVRLASGGGIPWLTCNLANGDTKEDAAENRAQRLEWEAGLEATEWLQNITKLLYVTKDICIALTKGQSVLIQGTNGNDRPPQLSCLVQLCLDPFYRTITGFSVLFEKEFRSLGRHSPHCLFETNT